MKSCATSMTRRRLKLSAIAPAASEKTMIGSVVEACTSATMLAELVIEVISQAAPTACTRPPKFDARLAIQIARNVGLCSGARAEVGGVGDCGIVLFSTLSAILLKQGRDTTVAGCLPRPVGRDRFEATQRGRTP